MYCDYHVHTNYSDDSTYLMEDVIKDAIKMKMDEDLFYRSCGLWNQKDWDEGPIGVPLRTTASKCRLSKVF